jgi:large subunit ribosomal protein L17
MLANMATSLILHKRITTTLAKAKALRTYVEPLITRSKQDSTHHRRLVFSYLQSKEAVTELFREVSLKVAERPGGYTRIIKLGNRLGDNAEMCLIELVDFNENLLKEKEGEKKTASRSTRRGRKGAAPKPAESKSETGKPVADAVETPPAADESPVQEVKDQAPETNEDKKDA